MPEFRVRASAFSIQHSTITYNNQISYRASSPSSTLLTHLFHAIVDSFFDTQRLTVNYAMAIMGSTTTRCPVAYGRSGYNK